MKKLSAGLLVYRMKDGHLEVLIAHMGGPFFAKKDKGAWSIPKGEYEEGQDPIANAKREFKEELGKEPPSGELLDLGSVTYKSGKTVSVWAVRGDLDVREVRSNLFEIEWPPRSGKTQQFPEADRAGWFSLEAATPKLIPALVEFLERLADKVDVDRPKDAPAQSSLF